jgi:hypothetical protein
MDFDLLLDSLIQQRNAPEVSYVEEKYAKVLKLRSTPSKGEGVFAEGFLSVQDPICAIEISNDDGNRFGISSNNLLPLPRSHGVSIAASELWVRTYKPPDLQRLPPCPLLQQGLSASGVDAISQVRMQNLQENAAQPVTCYTEGSNASCTPQRPRSDAKRRVESHNSVDFTRTYPCGTWPIKSHRDGRRYQASCRFQHEHRNDPKTYFHNED